MASAQRIRLLAFALCIATLLASCKGAQAEVTSPPLEETQAVESMDFVEDGAEIEITLPAPLEGDREGEGLTEYELSRGFTGVTLNDDGSATYTIGPPAYQEYLGELAKATRSAQQDFPETYGSIREVKMDDALSEVTIVVDREAFEGSFDAFAARAIYQRIALYKIFAGAPADELAVSVYLEDALTGEVFGTSTFPED